jgi:recombination associated protein RdgC
MFKNALVYRIDHWEQPPHTEIEAKLAGARFIECGATQPESHGFIAPRGDNQGALLESVGGQLILQLCSETKGVPSGVVKDLLEVRLKDIEAQTGRRPKGKMVKELKEEIVHSLLPRAFPKRGNTLIWIDLTAKRIVIGAASAKKADKVLTQLADLLGGGLRLTQLQTELSPATAMAAWLSEKEAPAGFSIDRECELKQPDSEKAAVRYARHTLDIDEVGQHIQQGKLPTQLAMTWGGRVSFVLTEALAIKKIKLLDVVLEAHQGANDGKGGGKDDGGFDADVALATGELRRLLPDLIEALGGEPALNPAAPAAVGGAGQPAQAKSPF